jgi:excisionase family DNA binding protein
MSEKIHLLTVSEVSSLLSLRKARIYALVREGLLPAVRFGRQVRIERGALNEWIRLGGRSLPGSWAREQPITEEGKSNE